MRGDPSAEGFSIAAHRLKFLCTLRKNNQSHVHNPAASYFQRYGRKTDDIAERTEVQTVLSIWIKPHLTTVQELH
jgi:hypothetical protein